MSYPFKFLTRLSMAAIKFEDSVRNSFVKRGLMKDIKHSKHVMCGCDFHQKDATCHFVTDDGNYRTPKEPPKAPQPRKKF